jgi:hypothetical protein
MRNSKLYRLKTLYVRMLCINLTAVKFCVRYEDRQSKLSSGFTTHRLRGTFSSHSNLERRYTSENTKSKSVNQLRN